MIISTIISKIANMMEEKIIKRLSRAIPTIFESFWIFALIPHSVKYGATNHTDIEIYILVQKIMQNC